MTARLGQNQYGKAETRVLRVDREGGTHRISDLEVSVALSGDLDEVHRRGDNTNVLTTDAVKNTVFGLAQEHGTGSAERFGLLLADHFVTSWPPIRRARVRIREFGWRAAEGPDGTGTGHSFVRDGAEVRTAEVRRDGGGRQVVSGLTGLVVMNTAGSEFRGFGRDRFTTLAETGDRVLATEVDARWRYRWPGAGAGDAADGGHAGGREPRWNEAYRRIRGQLLDAFATTYSRSLQQTLYAMGDRVIEEAPEVDEIRLSLPNRHHVLVDLTPFGIENGTPRSAVYFAADRPYGLIEGTVLRDGADPRIPADD